MTTKYPIITKSEKLYDNVILFPGELIKETCSICLMNFEVNDKVIKLKKCNGHFFHEDCKIIEWIKKNGKCPICKTMYGITKTYGPEGDMRINVINDGKYIEIMFMLKGGINPENNKRYYGETRIAYLPTTLKGYQVLELFKKAHANRLLFTIGYSLTRNQDNVIIYNGIHMKTSIYGGSHSLRNDLGYLDRVIEELNDKGIY